MELLCAAQAFDFRAPLKSSPILEACHDEVRRHIDHAKVVFNDCLCDCVEKLKMVALEVDQEFVDRL